MNFYFPLIKVNINKSAFSMKQMTKEFNERFLRYLNFLKLKSKIYEESFGLQQSFSFFILNKKVYCFNIIKNFLQLDLHPHKYNNEISILDLCNELRLIIPHFCYHYNLSIAGNCRMCLVELDGSKKPIASCALNASSQMHIKTDTLLVRRAREGIMEYLLANHPLDCPICDQGGECDLQDLSLVYGNDRGRFYNFKDFKKSVADFFLTSSVKLILTRCIYCTRCVRFLTEMEGNHNVGLLGRGKKSEIGLYETTSRITTELMSNIIDFCPVGALTGKFFSFNFRSWENIYVESIDLTDSFCTPIRIATDFNRVKRILPKYNSELNVYWINEKTRNFIDGYLEEQMDFPLYKCLSFVDFNNIFYKNIKNILKENIFYISFSWTKLKIVMNQFFSFKKIFKNFVRTFVGNLVDVFTVLKIKEINLTHGINNLIDCSEDNFISTKFFLNKDFNVNYIFNLNSFKNFKNIFLMNLNLRLENPVLNAKLRQKYVWDLNTNIFFFGTNYNLTYKYIHIGTNTKNILKIIEGRNYLFNFLYENGKDKKNLLLYSSELSKTYNNDFFKSIFDYLSRNLEIFEVKFLSRNVSTLNCFELGLDNFITKNNSNTLCDYFINVNEFLLDDLNYLKNLRNKYVVYQHYLRDDYFSFADVILPSRSFSEIDFQCFINCFGISRVSRRIFSNSNELLKHDYELISLVYSNITKVLLKEIDCSLYSLQDWNFFAKISFINFYKYKKNFFGDIIFSYIPLELYGKINSNFFTVKERFFRITKFHYYFISNKLRNFYKNSYITFYSMNVNIMSNLKFREESNYTL